MFGWGKCADIVLAEGYLLHKVYLDITVEDKLGESLQGRTFCRSQAGLRVEQRDFRRVSDQGCGVGVTEDFAVIVDGVANHHLPHEELQDLQTEKTFTHIIFSR